MVILDTTIVSVGLPTIQADLGFADSDLAWVVNAYLVTFGGLLLLAGRLGDLIGRRRMFLAGLAVFVVASTFCALSQNPGQLIASRFLQGVGGAMSSAVILGMLVTLFPVPSEQARAIGVYSFVGAAGASIGLIAGGVVTEALSWRWIFLVNLPIGLGTMLIATRVLREDRGLGLARGADVAGAALIVTSLMTGIVAIVGIEDYGFGASRTVLLLVLSVSLLVGFALREARVATPLVELRLFRVRALSAANAVQVFMIAGYFGQQFLVALYLQRVLGFGAAEVGFGMLPIALAIGAVSLGATASLIGRFGAWKILTAGMGLSAICLVTLGQVSADGNYWVDVLPALTLLGVGAGLSMPSLTTMAMSAVDSNDAGFASGLLNTTQQLGAAIGFAVLATVAAARTAEVTAGGGDSSQALADGYGLGLLVAGVSVLIGIALAAFALPRSARSDRDAAADRPSQAQARAPSQ